MEITMLTKVLSGGLRILLLHMSDFPLHRSLFLTSRGRGAQMQRGYGTGQFFAAACIACDGARWSTARCTNDLFNN